MSRQFFKKLINSRRENSSIPPLDGEILYSKNNVCVHPPGLLSNSIPHHAGFLTITAKVKKNLISLVLNWNPSSKQAKLDTGTEQVKEQCGRPLSIGCSDNEDESEVAELVSLETITASPCSDVVEDETVSSLNDSKEKDTIFLEDCLEVNPAADISKSPQAVHDFAFPENSIRFKTENKTYQGHVIRPPKNQAFGAFKVNLSHMRSLRLFFRDEMRTSGELVIASRESQYKVLHFHNGGLDCVAAVLKDWKSKLMENGNNLNGLCINHFSIILPNLSPRACHPEEGLYRGLTADAWSLHIDEFGRVQNEKNIQKAVFFGGVMKELRPAVWPFLLKFFRFDSTGIERSELQLRKLGKYQRINNERKALTSGEDVDDFWKNIACSVEKDVLRTDRANPFYRGEENPNLATLQRILLNYSVYTKTGYTQGMSDLLSPLLMEIQEESNVFWCFVGLMQRTIFISSPSDQEMEKQLLFLRELLRVLLPDFYAQLSTCGAGAHELLFAHRWILLYFKREFPEADALMIWEACWAHYQTNYFHLFVCVAIIDLYGADVVESNLASDEMLLHFSHLALQMNGHLVLKKARGLLHNLRVSGQVPCTLFELFCMETDGSEDQKCPVIVCAKTEQCIDECPHGGRGERASTRSKLKKLFQQT